MNVELKQIMKSLKEIESCQKSMSKSLYFIAKAMNAKDVNPYKSMPTLCPEDMIGKFICYHEEDDSIYLYADGVYVNRMKYTDYVNECAANGQMYNASLNREDYEKR